MLILKNVMSKKKKLSTNLVRGGINRSNFMETSEALFLSSGFVYQSAEEAESAFKEEKKKIYVFKIWKSYY